MTKVPPVCPWQTLLADGRGGIGYQLKDRVMDADQCLDAVSRVASGGMALDPTVIAKLLGRRARADPMAKLTERERSVLALMAEGLSNTAIAGRLFLSEGAISKYTTNIFTKLGYSLMTTPTGEYAPCSPSSTPYRSSSPPISSAPTSTAHPQAVPC